MLSQFDAAILAALQKEPWPDPAQHPHPAPLVAYTSATKLIASGLFALLLSVLIALMLRDNAMSDQAYEGWRLWLRITVAVGIAVLGAALLGSGVKAIISPEPQLELTAQGLHAPGIYQHPVPWSEIAAVLHDKPRVKIFGAGRVVIGVSGGARFVRKDNSDLKAARGPSGLDVVQLPQTLDVPVERLLAALQAFRAHFGHGGAKGAEQ